MLGKNILGFLVLPLLLITSCENKDSISIVGNDNDSTYYVFPYPFEGYVVYNDDKTPWFFSLNGIAPSVPRTVLPYGYFAHEFKEVLDFSNYIKVEEDLPLEQGDMSIMTLYKNRICKGYEIYLSIHGYLYYFDVGYDYYLPMEITTTEEVISYFDEYGYDFYNLPEEILAYAIGTQF